jgi:hypothetical protein
MLFEKGQSGNPLGRPPGARNRATVMAEELLQGEAEAITRTVIEKAKAGDMTALRICLDRFAPPRKERAIAFNLPPLATTSDALTAIAALAAATAEGDLTPSEAGEMFKLIEGYARTLKVLYPACIFRKIMAVNRLTKPIPTPKSRIASAP